MLTTDPIHAVLLSIDATLKELLALSRSKRAATPEVARPGYVPGHSLAADAVMRQPMVADDADLDSDYGDEPVKFKPRDWTGAFVKGQRMSESAPEFLDLLASSFAYFAQKNEESGAKADNGTPKAVYDRRSERRARGWAARLRGGWTPKAAPAMDAPMAVTEMEWSDKVTF